VIAVVTSDMVTVGDLNGILCCLTCNCEVELASVVTLQLCGEGSNSLHPVTLSIGGCIVMLFQLCICSVTEVSLKGL
jgi:hypothetical protein